MKVSQKPCGATYSPSKILLLRLVANCTVEEAAAAGREKCNPRTLEKEATRSKYGAYYQQKVACSRWRMHACVKASLFAEQPPSWQAGESVWANVKYIIRPSPSKGPMLKCAQATEQVGMSLA